MKKVFDLLVQKEEWCGWLEKNILAYLVIPAFFLSPFANIISFYLTGNKIDILRTVISWSIIFLVVFIWLFYIFLVRKNINWQEYLPFLISCLFIFVAGAEAFLTGEKYGGSLQTVLKYLIFNVIYVIPAIGAIIYLRLSKKNLDYVIRAIFPTAVLFAPYYMCAFVMSWLKSSDNLVYSLGGIDYLGRGYSAVFLWGCTLFYCLYASKKSRKIGAAFLSILYIFAAYWSGSRGVLLGGIVLALVLQVFSFCKKQYLINFLILVELVIVILSTKTADNLVTAKIDSLDEIYQQEIDETEAIMNEDWKKVGAVEFGEQDLFEMFLLDLKDAPISIEQIDFDWGGRMNAIREYAVEQVSDDRKETVDLVYRQYINRCQNRSLSRIVFYRLAWMEGKGHIVRFAPMNFLLKQRNYPHNIVLEVFADFGFVGALSIIVIGLWTFIRLIKITIRDDRYGILLLLALGGAVEAMLSGSVYLQPILIPIVTFVIGEGRKK